MGLVIATQHSFHLLAKRVEELPKMARRRLGCEIQATADVFDAERAVPPNEIEEIETHRVRERTQFHHLGQDKIADRVQP